MGIVIVGLGPGDPALLTRAAWDTLEAAQEVWLRTSRHPTVAGLPGHLILHSFDDLYESAEDFAAVYHAITAEVVRLGRRPEGVVYAVPGHPWVGEATVPAILSAARAEGQPVRVVEGLSFVEPTLSLLELDALDGLQVCDGLEVAARHHPPLNPDLPALLGQVYSPLLVADLKLTLMNQYPDEHPVTLVYAAGTPHAHQVRLPLCELDRQPLDHLTSLYVPPLPPVSSFEGLQETVAHLRAPDGCPWDRQQTHTSLRDGLLEEAYEAVAAIDAEDLDGLREELGDLLLLILLHTQIATEEGDFQMAEVIAGLDAKLKHRHPHVWGGVASGGTEEIVARWERLKREEKEERQSLLDGVPESLPALLQAHLYGERTAHVGFDWADASGVVEKVREELAELTAASTPEEREAELGDLLFAVVNLARHLGVEAEAALRQANRRFATRFRGLEQLTARRGLDLANLGIEGLEALWQEVKQAETG